MVKVIKKMVVVRQPCEGIQMVTEPARGRQTAWAGEEICLAAAARGSCIVACPITSEHPESMLASLAARSLSGKVERDRFGYKSPTKI